MSVLFGNDAGGNGQQPDPGTTPPASVEIPDVARDLVGEGKKYASVADALKALAIGQAHISKIEQENASLREQANKVVDPSETARLVKELLEQERSSAQPVVQTLDPSVVVKAVETVVTQKEAERTFAANEAAVEEAMVKKFGDKAAEVTAKSAKDLGLTLDEMRELVRVKPALARKALGLDVQSSTPSTPFVSSVNVHSLTPPEPTQPKPVMYGGSSQEIAAAWAYAGEMAKKQLGLT